MRLLVLTSRVSYPIEKGDKLRAFNFIRELSKYYDIFLFSIDEAKSSEESLNVLRQYCKDIRIFPISKGRIMVNLARTMFQKIPFQVGYYTSKKSIDALRQYYDEVKPDHIFCQLLRVTEHVKDIDIPKTIDIQDTMSVNIARSAKKVNILRRTFYNIEVRRLKRYEHDIFSIYDNKIIISDADRKLYPHPNKEQISIVPNGVDFSYFKPKDDIIKDIDIVFTGNMGYTPNIDASEFLIKKIMPIVKSEIPDVKIAIVGANPSHKLMKLQCDNVIVTGWVNDMRDYYMRAKVFIAPMRIGTGLQNKLLEAMAMRLPCITTPLANNSLKAADNTEILIGDDASSLANNIIRLLNDNKLAQQIADNGCQFVHRTYDWQNVGQTINHLIAETQHDASLHTKTQI